MNTIRRKIFADVLSRKGRTIMVALSIMVGVFGVVVLVSVGDLIVSQLEEDLQPDNIAMSHLFVANTGGEISLEENRAYTRALEALPGVVRVEGQAAYTVGWRKAGDEGRFDDGGVIMAYTENFEDVQLEPITRVIRGRYPDPGINEIAVELRFAEENGVDVGDRLVFQPLSPDAPLEEWEIVGVVYQPHFTIVLELQENVEPRNLILANYTDAQQITGFTGLSSFYVRYVDLAAAEAGEDDLKQAIGSETTYIPGFTFIDDPEDSFIIGQVASFISVLNILAIVAMIVSAFLVVNVINTIVVEQKKQIGVMKSLGASRFDTFMIYAGIALIYGVIGTSLGILVGVPVGSMMAEGLAYTALTYIDGFSISTLGVAVGLIMGLVVPVAVAFIPVFLGTRVSVLDAMTDLGIASNWGSGPIARLIGRLPFPVNIRQAFSNIMQKWVRLALTILTLTLAAAAFMGVTAVFTNLLDELDNIMASANFEIGMSTRQGQDEAQIRALAMSVAGVEAVYPGYSVAVDMEGYESIDAFDEGSNQILIIGIDPTTGVFEFDLTSGTGWADDPEREGIIISQSVADIIDKEAGDTVVITHSGNAHEYEIIGVDDFPFSAAYMNWRDLALLSEFVDPSTGEPVPNAFYVKLSDDDPTIEAVDDNIAELKDVFLAEGIVASYSNQPEEADIIAQQLGMFSMIFNISSGVMAVVGAIGLLATLSMAVYERQKEIGVMRSIGAGSWTISSQFLVEGLLVGVIAWVLSLPLSYLLGMGLTQALDFGGSFVFSMPISVLAMGLIGVMLIAAVASLWPSLSAARRTVSDILRYQ